jgi:CheY-like chemotaxis protein
MRKLLFIDDEEGIRRAVVRALKSEPYRTYTAENGEAGISFVKDNILDMETVISDYKMPVLKHLAPSGP